MNHHPVVELQGRSTVSEYLPEKPRNDQPISKMSPDAISISAPPPSSAEADTEGFEDDDSTIVAPPPPPVPSSSTGPLSSNDSSSTFADINPSLQGDPEVLREDASSSTAKKRKRLIKETQLFPCSFEGCTASFSQLGNLRTHERKHTGDRPYMCPHPGCEKRFTQMGNMKTHYLLHSGMKPYVCTAPGCARAFSQLGNLKSHVKKLHPGLNITLPSPVRVSVPMISSADSTGSMHDLDDEEEGEGVVEGRGTASGRRRSISMPMFPSMLAPLPAEPMRMRAHSRGSETSADWQSLMDAIVFERLKLATAHEEDEETACDIPPLPSPPLSKMVKMTTREGQVERLVADGTDELVVTPEAIILARIKHAMGQS